MVKGLWRIASCLAIGIMVLVFPVQVGALSQSQTDTFGNGILYFNSESANSCAVELDANLSGNGNIQKAFNFFTQKGLTSIQAAGIVANMKWESGLDPENIQNPAGRSKNPQDAGSSGWGIVQWTPASTKVPGIINATHINTPVYELGTQLQMVWAQLTGAAAGYSENQAGDDVKSTNTIENSVRAFQGDSAIGGRYTGFERPHDERATLADRISYARIIFVKYGGSSGTTTTEPSNNGDCSGNTGPGQDTKFIEGFTVYSQYDPSWVNAPYGSSTVGVSGCGPSAMAMIITALTDNQVTPDVTARYGAGHGTYIRGEGSSWTIASVLAPHWGLRARPIGASIANITATLQSGGLVIASGQGPLPFTSGGHYIVIRGVTADGKWKIGDSGHSNTSSQNWDPQQLIASMNDGSVYAVRK